MPTRKYSLKRAASQAASQQPDIKRSHIDQPLSKSNSSEQDVFVATQKLIVEKVKNTLSQHGIRRLLPLNNTKSKINLAAHFRKKTEGLKKIEQFERKGGVVVTPTKQSLFQLFENDIIFPICHSGHNRSQVMYRLLSDINIDVQLPHGAFNGFDPRFKSNAMGKYLYVPTIDPDTSCKLHQIESKAFFFALGHLRQKKFGSEICNNGKALISNEYPVTDEKVLQKQDDMVEYFDAEMFSLPEGSRRKVFICFNKAVEVVIERLMKHSQMKNVVVVAVPFDDPCKTLDLLNLATIYRSMYQDLSGLFIV